MSSMTSCWLLAVVMAFRDFCKSTLDLSDASKDCAAASVCGVETIFRWYTEQKRVCEGVIDRMVDRKGTTRTIDMTVRSEDI